MKRFGGMIAGRRSGKGNRADFLQSMLDRDSLPAEEKMDDAEIMDNLLTLIIAGQTTTAAAMMWSVKFLDENKEAQERLRVRSSSLQISTYPNPRKQPIGTRNEIFDLQEEQLGINKKKPEGEALSLEDINKMSYGLKARNSKHYNYPLHSRTKNFPC